MLDNGNPRGLHAVPNGPAKWGREAELEIIAHAKQLEESIYADLADHLSKRPVPAQPFAYKGLGGGFPDGAFNRITAVMFVVLISAAVLILTATFIQQNHHKTQCPRIANGYPLVSFQLDLDGDEINCQYGVSEVPQ